MCVYLHAQRRCANGVHLKGENGNPSEPPPPPPPMTPCVQQLLEESQRLPIQSGNPLKTLQPQDSTREMASCVDNM